MSLNGSGVRDISRVPHVSTRTVIGELKKVHHLQVVNEVVLQQMEPEQVSVEVVPVQFVNESEASESELDDI